MDRHELTRKLEYAVAGDADTVWRVHVSADADYQARGTALASARDSGIVNIGVQPWLDGTDTFVSAVTWVIDMQVDFNSTRFRVGDGARRTQFRTLEMIDR